MAAGSEEDYLAVEPLVARERQAIPMGGVAPDRMMHIGNSEAPGVTNVGGILEMRSASQLEADERAKEAEGLSAGNSPVIQALAGYIKARWDEARTAKEATVEPRMLKSLRQRRGEYDPDMKQALAAQHSALIYMMITSNKCRSAGAWLRESISQMPWSCEPTPVADVDDNVKASIVKYTAELIEKDMKMGIYPSQFEIMQAQLALKDQAFVKMQEMAKERAERMSLKMKDQLIEGHFPEAMDAFVDDLVTFPAAILKGPVVRVRPELKWGAKDAEGNPSVEVQDTFKLEWERVDPFNIYPAPDSTGVDDGYLIERHKLSRSELVSLRDVEGYSAEAINHVLEDYGQTGLRDLVQIDTDKPVAEGKESYASQNPSKLIDAYEFWGSVQGKMLIEWGMDEDEVSDPLAEYAINAWLVGNYVIRAVLNPDPLHRKPYYKTSWENVPGSFWGNSVPDLCRDVQAVCNAAARSLVNNMSIASGPQVVVDTSKLPKGEAISELSPWKIWQVNSESSMTSGAPISFFQPGSNSSELMAIYQQFSTLADEHTGIPRYMTGSGVSGGAGRTASGLSMLLSNAGKTIKGVVASIDRIMKPAIERLYMYNMRYLPDPELKGDVNIVVKGVMALTAAEQQSQRLNEFLNVALSNPVVNQIVGPEGIAYMLREVAKQLGMDTDKIVPSLPVLKARQAELAMQQVLQQQAAQQAQANGQAQAGGTPAKPQTGMDQRNLQNGSPMANAQAQTAS
jgi:hypothetical protein